MGRGKLPMELIANKKSRNSTFYKRKKGLMKKLNEFTTLCGVDACMIVYGPYDEDCTMELDIWPQNVTEVGHIISKYKSKGVEEKAKRNHDLSDFFEKRKHKINDDTVKTRRANIKAKYPVWDNRIYSASVDQLGRILGSIDSKIVDARIRSDLVKENQQFMKGGTQKMIGFPHMPPSPQSYPTNNVHDLYQKSMQLEANRNLQEIKPLDFCMPQNYMFDQDFQTRSFDINYRTIPTMTMTDDYCLGNSSSTNLQYMMTPLKPSICYDPTPGLLENEMYNNYPWTSSRGYYSPPSTQQPMQQQFVQRPIISNNASQLMMPIAPSQSNYLRMNDHFYKVPDFQIMNKIDRYY